MAYEASEITTAVALQYNSKFLRKVQTVKQLQSLLKKGIGKNVEFATSSIRDGFLRLVDPNNAKSIGDMAVGVSAALAIRNYMNTEAEVTTYMTGNKWPAEVEKFQISAFGFQDYNSADIIVTKNKKLFYGISLKKKPTVKAQDPTLINKAFASAFDGKEFTKLKEQLVETRINYFADLVIEAVDKKIILKKDIKNFDQLKRNNKKELFEAKNRDKNQFDKSYIDTKGYASSDQGYSDPNTRDPKSMRFFVNQKLSEKRNNKLWKSFEKLIDKAGPKLAENLINIILKRYLFDKLDAKDLEGKGFDFALVTGIADVKTSGDVNISNAKILPLKTTLCGLKRIEEKYKGEYRVIQDTEATQKSEAAKIFFKLVKGNVQKISLLDLEVRYKGSFNPDPQFQGGLTTEFKKLLDVETCG
tara:strand:+ start:71 stop:1318 length:1248 start_codon:yes stop_codon:yes gene_type:complete